MLDKQQYLLLSALGALSLVLAIANIILFSGNRTAQNEYSTRAQYIQQSLQLEPVYQGLIRGMAELAAQHDDAQLRELLAAQGITFTAKAREAGK